MDVSQRLRSALAERYEIEREAGGGGIATVYVARDLKLGRAVALKALRPELAAVLGGDRGGIPDAVWDSIRDDPRLRHL